MRLRCNIINFLSCCFFAATFFWQATFATTSNEHSFALKKVTQQIGDARNHLVVMSHQQLALKTEVMQLNKTIADHAKNLARINLQLAEQRKILANLKIKQTQTLQQLNDENISLSAQIRSAYLLHRQNYFKVLFNQQSPQNMSLVLGYYRYFNQARAALIAQLKIAFVNLQTEQQQTLQHSDQLQQLMIAQQQEQQHLQANEKTRQHMLTRLAHDVKIQDQQLSNLLASKQALEKVIIEAQKNAALLPSSTFTSHAIFEKMQGKLPAPVAGVVIQNYGSTLANSNLRLNAIVIKAAASQEVHAIYSGRVVFAGILRGFGLLIIIEHGQGYMSLYGQNESLYHKVGDFVQGGELIAKIGHDGNSSQSSLYFAIRHNGIPVDPEKWCHIRNT